MGVQVARSSAVSFCSGSSAIAPSGEGLYNFLIVGCPALQLAGRPLEGALVSTRRLRNHIHATYVHSMMTPAAAALVAVDRQANRELEASYKIHRGNLSYVNWASLTSQYVGYGKLWGPWDGTVCSHDCH